MSKKESESKELPPGPAVPAVPAAKDTKPAKPRVPYFRDKESVARLKAAIAQWIGTPFFEAAGGNARPGIGADCVSFADRVMSGIGATTPARWPKRYATHGGGRDMLSMLVGVIAGIPELEPVWQKGTDKQPLEAVIRPGDVVLCSTGFSLHHLAVYAGDNVLVHCLAHSGVAEGNLFDPIIYRNIRTLYRAFTE